MKNKIKEFKVSNDDFKSEQVFDIRMLIVSYFYVGPVTLFSYILFYLV